MTAPGPPGPTPAPGPARPPGRTCALCGTPGRLPFQAPPPELAPDLDLRPGEPTRSTLPRWMATCRGCGLSAPDLAEPPAKARQTMATPRYAELAGRKPELPFLRYALLCEAAGDAAEAAGAVLQAAWVLDDREEDAAPLRMRAAALWSADAATTMQDALRALDALRRAGAGDAAARQAHSLLARPDLGETDRAVVSYQQTLIAEGNTARHLMSSALRPPAQRPHVTHGTPGASGTQPKEERRGFWQRLVGR